MNSDNLDFRQRRLLDEIQIARTAGIDCAEAMEILKLGYGRTEYNRVKKANDRARLQEAGVVRKRKHYTPAQKQRLYDRQAGACPWCPKPLLIPARRNQVDHINVNLPENERESRKNLCLCHPDCNASKNAKSILEFSKHTGLSFTQILAKGDHGEIKEEAGEAA